MRGVRNRCLLAMTLPTLALLANATGCRKDAAIDAKGSKPAAVDVKASTPVASPGVSTASAASVAPNSRRPMDDAERASVAQYLKALTDGRKATKAARYADAIAAFNLALETRPSDPRAFAERGYAALLGKDYSSAEDDLRRAAQATVDRGLRAQVFYNLGLVREARGEDGTSAFALSNFLRPTAAARNKLGGKENCPVEVDRSPKDESVHYRDWLAFYTEYESAFLHADTKPESNDAARKLLCGASGCAGRSPWLVDIEGRKSFLVSEDRSGLAVATVALTWFKGGLNFCYPSTDASIVQRNANLIVVRVRVTDGVPEVICDPVGKAHARTEEELAEHERNPESQDWVRGCRTSTFTSHKVFDSAAKRWTLTVTQFEDLDELLKSSERIGIQVDSNQISVTGPNCRVQLPLSAHSPVDAGKASQPGAPLPTVP